ncbi:MAG: hypothetical protein R8P61_27050 [Bacteroidia bacterium]|nr:hypothetical protein [Bacteroidia bacterium]
MRKILVLLFISCFCLSAFSRECLIYERELEAYFEQYQSGDMVDMDLLDRLDRRCEYPSEKFNMILYYFLAVDAYHSNSLTDEEAYYKASSYYDKCASYFSAFDWTSKERFIENFYTRAEGLEVVLADLAYDLDLDRRDRYVQNARGVNASPWRKTNVIRFSKDIAEVDRGQRNPEPSPGFSRQYADGDEYSKYPKFKPNPTYDKEGEPYGYVGNITDVNPIDYIKFVGNHRSNPRERENDILYTFSEERARYAEEYANARVSRGNYRQISRGQREPLLEGDLIAKNERIELMDKPGVKSLTGESLGFGEYALRVPSQAPVVKGGKSYMKVEVRGGRTGWVPSEAIVQRGELAVLLENTRGYPKINMRNNDRNAVLFKAGELVILEDYREGMVKAVSRNGQKSAWIKSLGNISIEEEDLQIATLLHTALNTYSDRDLRSQLEAIKYVPGFATSPLSRIVEDNIRYLNN